MRRRVKEFVEIKDYTSLDELIARLVEVREALPDESEAVVKMKGDDVFGRLLCVSFFRAQTAEEAECDARYAEAYRRSRELSERSADAESLPATRGRRLRAAA